MAKILAAIPSYDRPRMLDFVLKKLVNLKDLQQIVIVADASSQKNLKLYKEILSQYPKRVVAKICIGRRGSAEARNDLLNLVWRNADGINYVLLLDDDCLMPRQEALQRMVDDLEMLHNVSVVGGRVIDHQRRSIDPDLLLAVPARVADWLTKITGFIFRSGQHKYKIGYEEFTSHFMLIRSNLLGKISYDEKYQGTGYREESDLHRQVARLGFKIFSDHRAYVYHLPIEEGGNRDRQEWSQRMYWKARNHTYFILKWNGNKLGTKLWYMLMGAVVLNLYRISCFYKILQGLQHGYKLWISCKQ